MNKRKILENTAKGLASAVFPPALAFFGKNEKSRVGLGALGTLVLSMVPNAIQLHFSEALNYFPTPTVHVGRRPNNLARMVPEFFASPILFRLDSHPMTFISGKDYFARLQGDDIITFDKETGQYTLNLDEATRFDNDTIGKYKSLAQFKQNQASELEKLAKRKNEIAQEQQRLESEGKLVEAQVTYGQLRKANEIYLETAQRLEEEYTVLESEHEAIKSRLNYVVNEMSENLAFLKKRRRELQNPDTEQEQSEKEVEKQ